MAAITYDHATVQYPGAERPSVNALNLDIADGEFLVLVGPSGCGKSTSLRALAGLENVTEGSIRIGDRDVTHLAPKDRDIAMVFQNYALYPHMTVADNMGFALKISGMNKDEMRKRVEEAAKILDLTQYLDRKPKALSGGQRQRVAMGRAIVRNPQAFLMDEPLSNLDAKLRVQTRTEIAALQRRLGRHHRLRHPRPGRGHDDGRPGVRAQGRRPDAGRHPAQPLRQAGQRLRRRLHRLPGDEPGRRRPRARTAPTWAAARSRCRGRPWPRSRPTARRRRRWASGPSRRGWSARARAIPFEVVVVEELGSDAFAYGTMHTSRSKEGDKLITLRVDARRPPMKGETIHIQIDPAEVHVFSAESGRRVSGDVASASTSTGGASGRCLAASPRPDPEPHPGRAAAGTSQSTPGGPSPPPGSIPRPSQCPKECTCAPDRDSPRQPRWAPSPSSRPAASARTAVAGGGNDNTSNTIEVMYAFSGGQEDGFKAEVDAWAEENDVTVNFSQTGNFNQLINTRVQGNDAPDVALFPQPGIMREMADQGLLADLSDIVDQDDLDNTGPGRRSRPGRSTARSTRCR